MTFKGKFRSEKAVISKTLQDTVAAMDVEKGTLHRKEDLVKLLEEEAKRSKDRIEQADKLALQMRADLDAGSVKVAGLLRDIEDYKKKTKDLEDHV